MTVPELLLAGFLFLLGVRSLVRWFGIHLEVTSPFEQLLFMVNLTARVGLWFAFAGFFLGYALIDDVSWIDWYVFVPLGLAALQLLTTVLLGRGPARPRE